MLCCAKCGSSDLVERANGKTVRAVLQAALDLSAGEHLVLRGNTWGFHHHRCRTFVQRVREVVYEQGYLREATENRLITVNGGSLTWLDFKANEAGLRFTKEITVI